MEGLTPLSLVALPAFGAVIGLLGSALGIGGGIFIVPALVLVLGMPMHQAVAASLAAIVATSSAVASVNVERGLANIRLGITLEVTTALGSLAGALAASRLSSHFLQLLFALTLFPVSALMFLRARGFGAGAAAPAGGKSPFDAAFFDPAAGAHTPYAVRNMAPASAVSFFAGSLSGLLGIGGGIVQVPLMNLLCGVPMKAAAATSNFVIGVSAAASAFVYFRKGQVPLGPTAVLVAGVLAGSFLGMRLLYKAKSEKLQLAFAALALLVGMKMLMKSL